ncbi:hypothetical protein PPACK8108_LOCUS6815 [Phakopsora pachyrhizi]|uniref:Uncharacterized protein n=1 Tax=Phakopsora pachyrhizi TaxID=170000 RepID=A0AAV0AV23_PHAPC|nr:hypothetical protein PPACK8108_LOCUS6815 [Phakopsora pachyrhizi]
MRLRKKNLKRIDKDSKTQNSALPTQSSLVNSICPLVDIKRELNDLGDSNLSPSMNFITEFWQGLSNSQDKAVVLKTFVDFRKLIIECDLSFSRLLNKLDELPDGKRNEGSEHTTTFKELQEIDATKNGREDNFQLRLNYSCDLNQSTRSSSSRQGFQSFNSLNSTKV